ncbi:alpha/beta fold hydrolase [Aliifodinibius sp. S!AR15-10]|uniref:alpha/beta hydrolase family protein n=1 Tax=Aliifodinibius sp. S!AR15-10 TaxID=2950437 RepID=UPI00285E3D69|nr:alpha/beta fold hydrolase [Aliifodinibius sp. S!AR15-10]MDR8392834.1 alpha/beta fold hydrolase [Aliifodinibius sp. S!AR15-10]
MPFSNIVKSSGSVASTEDLPIYYDLYVPSGNSDAKFPVILFLHGFKGFKDWGPFPDACHELASAGFAVLAMNFSLNGVGESMTEFDQLDLFARETFSQDLDDVGTVISALKEGGISSDKAVLETDTMGVLGHSRGGQTAVAAAAEYPEISCVVTWSAVADYNARWSDQMRKDWESRGYTEIMNGRTGQVMRIDKVVFEDARDNADRVIALNRVKNLHLPILFIHSRDDESVSHKETETLFQNCPSKEKEISLVNGTGHTYGGAHPFEEDEFPEKFAEVLEDTSLWFEEYLK